jgi:heme/copper-type cytochrome/quinol oxidase subunit 3
MLKRAPVIGFLVVQVLVVLIYVLSLAPLLQAGTVLVSHGAQIWSGGAFSNTVGNFRSGSSASMAAPFKPYETLLWGTLLMLLSAGAAWYASRLFRAGRIWAAVGIGALVLALGAGSIWCVITQWSGDTLFPPGAVSVGWGYAITRAWVLQFFIGFALLAVAIVLAIAGLATRERPLGFYLVALNWLIVAAVWVLTYLTLYVVPALGVMA